MLVHIPLSFLQMDILNDIRVYTEPDFVYFICCVMDLQVRFELKTDKGSNMVSVLPPPEELLFPEPVSRADFQRVLSVLGHMDRDDVCCQVSLQPTA